MPCETKAKRPACVLSEINGLHVRHHLLREYCHGRLISLPNQYHLGCLGKVARLEHTKINATGHIKSIPVHTMQTRRQLLIHQNCNFLSHRTIYFQGYVIGLEQCNVDCCRSIEGIWISRHYSRLMTHNSLFCRPRFMRKATSIHSGQVSCEHSHAQFSIHRGDRDGRRGVSCQGNRINMIPVKSCTSCNPVEKQFF